MNSIDTYTSVAGGVAAPAGFTASGVAAAVKEGSTKKDCALIVSEGPATVAGTFTTNVMKAPPVQWNTEICADTGAARAVFINSGNANAATGAQGYEDSRATAARVAAGLDLAEREVCVCSTGVIGEPLPMDRIANGVDRGLGALSRDGSSDAAHAIMTTDTVPKEAAIEVPLSTGLVHIGAIAKGSGMIAPNMATMICIMTTDAAVDAAPLNELLHDAVNVSFNRMCIDNDMSTSDTVLCFANGQADAPKIEPGSDDWTVFSEALTALAIEMAQRLVRDGEGASKFVEIAVSGAPSDDDAKTIARAVAVSQLCKTAFFGEDPNWGRIACAAGYAGVPFDPEHLAIWLGDVQLVADGGSTNYAETDAAAVMQQPEFRIRVDVGDGAGSAVFWTSDLSHDYVTINADYRT
ncbi:MAG: bifunctional glutamate N-acetyltransferase/amino-acid acetyltransferase ArgJ [bacterium]|nr:bifunctional glutamate N-acetyltransferase/amino-acid acetyltransferase ArgJ [bacterium]